MNTPKITLAPLTNTAYGFPRGAQRSVKPIALACLHITGNASVPPATAVQERAYANRAGSDGPSAHFYVDRDGSAVQAIDPDRFAAWSNGDVNAPKLAVPGVQAVVDFRATHNANEAYAVEIETCGKSPDYPITSAQESTIAYLVAQRSLATGLPIERRTVHLHSDLNTITRASCPVSAGQAEAYAARIIAFATDYAEILTLRAQNADLKAASAAQASTIEALKLDLRTKTQALADAQQSQADALATVIRWEDYGREAASHAGSILGLDHPEVP